MVKVLGRDDPTARKELEVLTRARHNHIIKYYEAISQSTRVCTFAKKTKHNLTLPILAYPYLA